MYADAWRKATAGEPLAPLEAQIAQIVAEHPEYQDLLGAASLQADYTPDGGASNPFLHMGLHLAIREQVATNRPPGIRVAYEALNAALADQHDVEHRMLDCLAETLWESQRDQRPPDETVCLRRLNALAGIPDA